MDPLTTVCSYLKDPTSARAVSSTYRDIVDPHSSFSLVIADESLPALARLLNRIWKIDRVKFSGSGRKAADALKCLCLHFFSESRGELHCLTVDGRLWNPLQTRNFANAAMFYNIPTKRLFWNTSQSLSCYQLLGAIDAFSPRYLRMRASIPSMGFHFEMEVPRRRELRMFEITFLLHADTEIFYPEKLMEFKKALVERCCQPIWYQIACKAALQLTFYSM